MNKLEAIVTIEVKGILRTNIKGHPMDKVDDIINKLRKHNPIKINIEGELGEEIEFIGKPNLKIRTDNYRVKKANEKDKPCTTCDGTGEMICGDYSAPCPHCQGSGVDCVKDIY